MRAFFCYTIHYEFFHEMEVTTIVVTNILLHTSGWMAWHGLYLLSIKWQNHVLNLKYFKQYPLLSNTLIAWQYKKNLSHSLLRCSFWKWNFLHVIIYYELWHEELFERNFQALIVSSNKSFHWKSVYREKRVSILMKIVRCNIGLRICSTSGKLNIFNQITRGY